MKCILCLSCIKLGNRLTNTNGKLRQENYKISHLLTTFIICLKFLFRMNQDPVENCFSILRGRTPGHHPTPSEAIDQLRIYMLTSNSRYHLSLSVFRNYKIIHERDIELTINKFTFIQDLVNDKASYKVFDENNEEPTLVPADLPPLFAPEPIPESEENPYVGDSPEGVEFVSGFIGKISAFLKKMVYELKLCQL